LRAAGEIVAVLDFGASTWKIRPREEDIGWTSEQRRRNLDLILNNARSLILPWIQCRNSAWRSLALIAAMLGGGLALPLRASLRTAKNFCRRSSLPRNHL